MPEPIGCIVEPLGSGESGSLANPGGAFGSPQGLNGNQGSIREPEIISGFETIDTAEFAAGAGDTAGDAGEPRRTRSGRIDRRTKAGRTGSTAGAEETPSKSALGLDSLSLTDLLYSIHMMGAKIIAEEFELEKAEAEKLSKAIQQVGKHYAMDFDPKKVAIANLCAVAGSIYVPRIIAATIKRKKGPAEVRPISQPAPKQAPLAQAPNPQKDKVQNEPRITVPSDLWAEPAGEGVALGF